jgi:hypothetical protein
VGESWYTKHEIIHNRIRCRKCGDVIESHYTHDFKFCKCGTVFVDGGHDYLRRGGDLSAIEDLGEVKDANGNP